MCFPFLFQTKSVWKPLNHHRHTQNCENLIGLAAKYSISCRVGTGQFWSIQMCLFLFLTHSAYLTKHTHLRVVSLSVFCKLSPRPTSMSPRGRNPGFGMLKGFWHEFSSREFSRATSMPGCHTSGGTERHCDPAPTFRGLLRGTTEENTECHCYVASTESSAMKS